MDAKQALEEDLKIIPGTGATMSVGSDSYPYYVTEVLPNGVIGLYKPSSHWDASHTWEGGTQVVSPFDPHAKTEQYIKRRYGKWWVVEANGRPISRFTSKWERLRFGHAVAYQNPSF